jgi:hypothetical protein
MTLNTLTFYQEFEIAFQEMRDFWSELFKAFSFKWFVCHCIFNTFRKIVIALKDVKNGFCEINIFLCFDVCEN